jgi:hypothetical protein
MAYHNNFPSHPSTPSYSFKDRYKVHNGYKILHLPSLVYPNAGAYVPGTIFLDVPTTNGALILGGSTAFVSNPHTTQIINSGDMIYANSLTQRVKTGHGVMVTGCRLQIGVRDGQHLYILTGPAAVQFDADENVSKIKTAAPPAQFTANKFNHLIWNATAGADGDGLWYRG